MRTEESQLALFRRKVFWQMSQKTLPLPLEQYGTPAEIRIVTMSQFHQRGYK
ncbi:hypothetical protein H8S57_13100 [Lawsonibacter sp. NSJ-51]|uniref:Uncharacterized protein n=1 Tax=Lawsonibacter hominis TaxID=2763053 RepID=A0A8J6JI60_9FIRM|nr:hypothetical protein [Lawsonibacter hominis]